MFVSIFLLWMFSIADSVVVLHSPNDWSGHTPVPVSAEMLRDRPWITFHLKTTKAGEVHFRPQFDDGGPTNYIIVICGWTNTRTAIRRLGEEVAYVDGTNCLDANELRPFWVSWGGGLMAVGQGLEPGLNQMLNWTDPGQPLTVNYLRVVTGSGTTGDWVFDIEPDCSVGYSHLEQDALYAPESWMLTDTVTSPTPRDCAQSCHSATWCRSFSFKVTQQECRKFDVTPYVANLTEENGWETWTIQ